MSRSKRAWMESCAPVSAAIGAGARAGLEEQAPLGPGLLLGAVSSTKRLVRFLAVSMLVIALAPASALAGAASGHHAKPSATQKEQRSAHIHQAGALVLALGSGFSSREGAARVRALQRRLAGAGDAPGPIDGRFGPRTEQAVIRFQAARGLRVDGIAGALTLAAIGRPAAVVLYPGTGYTRHGSESVRALQRRLAGAGDAPGPIDGRYGPRTEQGVRRFQAARGLQVDGIAGPQTLADLGTQRTSYQVTRTPRATGSHHAPSRFSVRGRPRPHTAHRQSRRATAPSNAAPHLTSSPGLGVPSVVIMLAAAFVLAAMALVGRRRSKRSATADAVPNDASRSGPSRAINGRPIATPTLDQDHGAPDEAGEPLRARNPGEAGEPLRAGKPDQEGQPDDADRLFRHALALEEEGELSGAVAAYQRADQLGHGTAASNLGVLLEQHGDAAAAEACYRRANQRGDADGSFNLALLLGERGDHMGGLEAYERADELGHPTAASNLGVLLGEHGDLAAAEACFRRADQRGDAHGAFNLAVLLGQQGDRAGALEAYQRAVQLGNGAIADRARTAALDLTRLSAAGKGGGHDGP
jgi:peptidoglycan hydrolase-like protein with peptidoglycan-binding domain/Flp pilus assembly protein TadD